MSNSTLNHVSNELVSLITVVSFRVAADFRSRGCRIEGDDLAQESSLDILKLRFDQSLTTLDQDEWLRLMTPWVVRTRAIKLSQPFWRQQKMKKELEQSEPDLHYHFSAPLLEIHDDFRDPEQWIDGNRLGWTKELPLIRGEGKTFWLEGKPWLATRSAQRAGLLQTLLNKGNQAVVPILRIVKEIPAEEIAESLDLTLDNVYQRISRFRRQVVKQSKLELTDLCVLN
jgi:hypothetical protein